MLHYKQLILATDLTEEADNIANKAASIAKRSNAKLSIIYVIEHTPIVYGGGEFSIPLEISFEEHLASGAKKALNAIASRHNILPNDQYIAHGSVKREVLELADKIEADLIIVGSHGQSGMEYLLGSTANAILHAAKCDVLAVRVSR
jgi:universal stress protein A